MKEEYLEYLKSAAWKDFRQRILNNPYYGSPNRCFVCGSKQRLTIHHLRYDRLYEERPEDVMILCQHCHNAVFRMKSNEFGPYQLKRMLQERYRKAERLPPARAGCGWVGKRKRSIRRPTFGTRKKHRRLFRYVGEKKPRTERGLLAKLGTVAYYKLLREGKIQPDHTRAI